MIFNESFGEARVRTLLLMRLNGLNVNGLATSLENRIMIRTSLDWNLQENQRRSRLSNTWKQKFTAEVARAGYTWSEIKIMIKTFSKEPFGGSRVRTLLL